MNKLKQYLTLARFQPQEHTRLRVDPSTRFGYVADEAGKPLRVDSRNMALVVPVYDWQVMKIDEDDPIALVLQEAAMQSPLKLPSLKTITRDFWVKNNTHVKAFLFYPSLHGKFYMPAGVPIYKSEILAPDRITCLGPAPFAGYYLQQGHSRGVLAHDKKGLRSLQVPPVA